MNSGHLGQDASSSRPRRSACALLWFSWAGRGDTRKQTPSHGSQHILLPGGHPRAQTQNPAIKQSHLEPLRSSAPLRPSPTLPGGRWHHPLDKGCKRLTEHMQQRRSLDGGKPRALVSGGHCNEVPQTWWLENLRNAFSYSSGARSLNSLTSERQGVSRAGSFGSLKCRHWKSVVTTEVNENDRNLHQRPTGSSPRSSQASVSEPFLFRLRMLCWQEFGVTCSRAPSLSWTLS